jgi:hypothetical protein
LLLTFLSSWINWLAAEEFDRSVHALAEATIALAAARKRHVPRAATVWCPVAHLVDQYDFMV